MSTTFQRQNIFWSRKILVPVIGGICTVVAAIASLRSTNPWVTVLTVISGFATIWAVISPRINISPYRGVRKIVRFVARYAFDWPNSGRDIEHGVFGGSVSSEPILRNRPFRMRPPVPVAPSQSTVRCRVLDEVLLNLPAHTSHPAPSQLEEPTNGGQRTAVLPTSVVTEDHVVDISSPAEQESLSYAEESTPRNQPAFAPPATGNIEVHSEPTNSEQESFYSSFSVAPSNINTSTNQAMQSPGYESSVSDRWSALSIQPGSPQSPYQLDYSSSQSEYESSESGSLHPPDPATSLSPQNTLSFSSYSSREHSPASSQYSDVPVLEPSPPSSFNSLIVGGTTVRCTFIPTLDDELWIAVGEIIKVLREYDDGWALCENAGRQRGVVPVECLERGPVKVEHRMRNHT